MKRSITSLPALETFRAAARHESFSQAADSLNLTHGAVSRAVRILEEDLGAKLFERRNRSVFLTDNGRKLAQAVAHGLGHIEAAVRSIRAAQTNAPITVSCEPTLLMRWLIPRVADFHEKHPQTDIRLVAGGGPITLDAEVDVAIRRNDFDLPHSYTAQPLFDEWIGPVCRPDLHDKFFKDGRLRSDTPLLHSKTRPTAWQTWADLANAPLEKNPELEFEHFYFSLQAAVAGLGVAIGPWHLVRDDLSGGIFSAPLGFIKDGSKYMLLTANQGIDQNVGAVFRDWLVAFASQEHGPE